MKYLTKETIDTLLDVKDSVKYYREQAELSKQTFLLSLTFTIHQLDCQQELKALLLRRLVVAIQPFGYIVKQQDMLTVPPNYCYQIKFDPLSIDEGMHMFSKVQEIIRFSEENLTLDAVQLSFSKQETTDKEKVHHRLTTFLMDQNQYFSFPTTYIWNYRLYLQYQMNHAYKKMTLNYLKRREIEINNIRTDLSCSELKNLITGLFCEIYETSFLRSKGRSEQAKRLYTFLDHLPPKEDDTMESQPEKILIYFLKKDQSILLDLSEELEEKIHEELSKTVK